MAYIEIKKIINGRSEQSGEGRGCARTLRDNIRFWSMTVGCLLWPTEGFNSSF